MVAKKAKMSASEAVFDSILNDITNLEYSPGDRLPSENDLAAQYGVSRVTIRKALNMLLALGVIETRTGGGSYVQKFKFSRITDAAAKIMVNQVSSDDIMQYRRLLEMESLRSLKTTDVRPADLLQLKKYCSLMEECANKGDYDEFADNDFQFHRFICKMSHNALFVYSYDMLGSVMVAHMKSRYRIVSLSDEERKNLMLLTAEEHRKIVDAIADGTCEDLLSRMLSGTYTELPV